MNAERGLLAGVALGLGYAELEKRPNMLGNEWYLLDSSVRIKAFNAH